MREEAGGTDGTMPPSPWAIPGMEMHLLTCARSHSSLAGTRPGFPRYWQSPNSADPDPARRQSSFPILCRSSCWLVYSKYWGGGKSREET